jgi:carbon monoxide dehydrogenase subunit G
MNLSGETIIAASPADVWLALNDPDVLRQCIPGCETLDKVSNTEFKATVATRIGPMSTRFNGAVTLSDLDPPRGYTISGSGNGGVAGNAKGSAKVRLEPHEQGTRLTYDVDAQVSGKLAQLGSRLIDGVAKMMAGQFFEKFGALVAAPPAGAEEAAPSVAARAGGSGVLPRWAVVALAAAAAVLVYMLALR